MNIPVHHQVDYVKEISASTSIDFLYNQVEKTSNESYDDFDPIEVVKISNKTKTWGMGITVILLLAISIPFVFAVFLVYKSQKGKNKFKSKK